MIQIHDGLSLTDRMPQRLERKFYLSPQKIDLAYGLLRHMCRFDREYPAERINSLYFDTAGLDQYIKSQEGESRKDKVRIRWYGEDRKLEGNQTVYIELKSRQGFAGTKKRLKMQAPTEHLSTARLREGIISRSLLSDTLASFGYIPPEPLQPVIKISYWRYRFSEALSGQRVSLDYQIKSTMIMPGLGHEEKDMEITGGVIEVKGLNLELPVMLKQLKLLDLDWGRFSKYSACIDAHLDTPDTIGRLSPSGRIIE